VPRRTDSAFVRDQDINTAPFLDDSCDHCPDRFLVADIDLDPQGGATRRLDLGDSAVSGHVPLPRLRIRSYECALNRAFELFAPESQTGFQTVPGSWRKETATRSGGTEYR
jgi:hypothetical protein